MEKRDLNLAEAAHKAAAHLPRVRERGAGVAAFDAFIEAFEAEIEKQGYRIERVRGPVRWHSAGD